jgi:hypothetical protein
MHPLIHHHQETIFGPIDEPINANIRGAIDNEAVDTPDFVDEEGKKPITPLLLEEEPNGVVTSPGIPPGDFSSEVSSQILDANVLFYIAPHSHHRRRRHAPIHHHQETIFGSIDEGFDPTQLCLEVSWYDKKTVYGGVIAAIIRSGIFSEDIRSIVLMATCAWIS